jgi:hypothetical protein
MQIMQTVDQRKDVQDLIAEYHTVHLLAWPLIDQATLHNEYSSANNTGCT